MLSRTGDLPSRPFVVTFFLLSLLAGNLRWRVVRLVPEVHTSLYTGPSGLSCAASWGLSVGLGILMWQVVTCHW